MWTIRSASHMKSKLLWGSLPLHRADRLPPQEAPGWESGEVVLVETLCFLQAKTCFVYLWFVLQFDSLHDELFAGHFQNWTQLQRPEKVTNLITCLQSHNVSSHTSVMWWKILHLVTRVQDEIHTHVSVSLYVWVQVRFAGDVAFAMQLWARNLHHLVCVCSVLCVSVMFCLCHHACTCVEMPLLSLAFAKQSCCSYVLICSATAMCAYIYIYICIHRWTCMYIYIYV